MARSHSTCIINFTDKRLCVNTASLLLEGKTPPSCFFILVIWILDGLVLAKSEPFKNGKPHGYPYEETCTSRRLTADWIIVSFPEHTFYASFERGPGVICRFVCILDLQWATPLTWKHVNKIAITTTLLSGQYCRGFSQGARESGIAKWLLWTNK